MHPDDASFEAVNQDALAERLVLASEKLFGHEKEWSALQKAYECIIVGGAECNVVLVSGSPGSGKTTLVKQSARRYLMKKSGHLLYVKFDKLHQQGGPLSAIISLLDVFCENINNSVENKKLDLLKISLEAAVGTEGID
eukprot:11717181-Ditylum_brightwellii.AAC.1